MRAEGPNQYPYTLGMALNHYKLKPKVSICFRLQSGLENWHFSIKRTGKAVLRNINIFFK